MALIECEDCGEEVSDRAPACVKCGAPIGEVLSQAVVRDENGFPLAGGVGAQKVVEKKSSGGVFEFLGFVLIVAGMVGCVASQNSPGMGSSLLLLGGFAVFLAGRFMR